jgi:hypothetical protein
MFAELFLKYFSIIFHGMKKPGVVCVGLMITAACLYPALCAPGVGRLGVKNNANQLPNL